ncbi:hypothetical protein KI387_003512, partial [Taxus chinensis]
TEHWCRMNGLIYLGVDFTTSPLGNAPPRSKQYPKGKGKAPESPPSVAGIEGESSTIQEESPESPPSAAPEQ